MDLFNIKEKVAIVTGASKGIGRSVALAFAKAGAHVVICSRTTNKLEELAEEIKSKGAKVLIAPCDVSKPNDIDSIVNKTLDKFRWIDILINNAGVTKKHDAENFSLEDWELILSVNLTGVFQFAQKVGKIMLEQGFGSIINISSVGSVQAVTKSIAYSASKGGVAMVTKNLASEWVTKGVRVNAIVPAYIETPLLKGVKDHRPGFYEDIINRTPMRRLGRGSNFSRIGSIFIYNW